MAIRIKFKGCGTDGNIDAERGLADVFNRLTKNNDYRWRDLIITKEDNWDYIIVLGSVKPVDFPLNKCIVLHNEPSFFRKQMYKPPFLKPEDDTKFFRFFDIDRNFPVDHWMLDLNYKQMSEDMAPKKTKLFSGLISGMQVTDGHKLRVNFVKDYLDKLPYYESYITRVRNHLPYQEVIKNLRTYKGEIDEVHKVYVPYKYVFQAENVKEKNYFTEKIKRSIICECLTFYHGCPNIEDFINPRAMIRIDMNHPKDAINTIRKYIKNNEWEKRIEYIKEEKQKLLNENNPLNIIWKIIHKKI